MKINSINRIIYHLSPFLHCYFNRPLSILFTPIDTTPNTQKHHFNPVVVLRVSLKGQCRRTRSVGVSTPLLVQPTNSSVGGVVCPGSVEGIYRRDLWLS